MPGKLGSLATGQSVGAVSSLTISVTVPSSSNRCLVLEDCGWSAGLTPTDTRSVTWNSISLTKAGVADLAYGNYTWGALWYLKDASLTTATANLVISAVTSSHLWAGVRTWGRVDQTTPFGAMVSALQEYPPATNPSVTVTTGINAQVIDVLSTYNVGTPTLTATYDAEWNVPSTGGVDISFGSSSRLATTTSTQIGWTISPAMTTAGSEYWLQGAAALNDDGGLLMGQSHQMYVLGLGA